MSVSAMGRFLSASRVTVDGKTMVEGVYSFYETCGLPLEIIGMFLRFRRLAIDWESFGREMMGAGVSLRGRMSWGPEAAERAEELMKALEDTCPLRPRSCS